MISDLYKRREKLGYVILFLLLLVFIGWLIFQTPETQREWLELAFFLLPLGFAVSIIMISRSHYNKVKEVNIPNSQRRITELNHVVIKKDAGIIPRLLLFEKNGEFIGMLKPINTPWWLYPLYLFSEEATLIFTQSYGFESSDGKTLFTFNKRGWLKQVKLSIYDPNNIKLGTYIQEELKALFNIKGKIINEKNENVLVIEASGFSGDFKWYDVEGKQWARFYNGLFPHEYTKIFRDSQNDIVELSDQLEEKDKIRLLSVIGYLFMTRIKQ
ncbi:hypothetical protein [Cytobacillus gottheilii]|uniref:Uncharacterized protein n=1 Tax=Cytobacillus gottheilii TaxID=859144 RepID=A0ABX8FH47_9BACI|nr:hypothetical protein [Cytobacillus gottheilii]QVY63327.1 hypothetical protein J1899_09870 [Cytobacillus gottheilii]